jgi:sulfate/thiosulfate transport system substrate-binding protein
MEAQEMHADDSAVSGRTGVTLGRAAGALLRITLLAATLLGAASAPAFAARAAAAPQTLLNVSYDATRELYQQINARFQAYWKRTTGQTVRIQMSHNGSAAQARAVIAGLPADVVTLGVASDIDALHDQAQLLPADWQSRLPNDSTPYTSTIVFLVRNGNPKHIVDWDDLVRPGVSVITTNPKTSAAARWVFLAAYAYAQRRYGGDPAQIKSYLKALYGHVAVLSTGARGSTLAFAQQRLGDVLLAWENEAHLAIKQAGPGSFQIVVPSISMLAQPPVAVVDKNARQRGTERLAEAYLRYLYTPEAQEIIAQNFYRPVDPAVAARHAAQFPRVTLVNISAFGGWRRAQAQFFDDGGLFDQLY